MPENPPACSYSSEFLEHCQFEGETTTEFEGKPFCDYHLPEAAKKEWSAEQAEGLLKRVLRVIGGIVEGRCADLRGVHFPAHELDLSKRRLPDVDCRGCKFLGTARFTGSEFTGAAQFEEARFHASALFNGASFAGEAHFRDAEFLSRAEFGRVRFTKKAGFLSARFHELAWFPDGTFSDWAVFAGAIFLGDAWFTEAKYEAIAWFEGARFLKESHFEKTTFQRDGAFEEVTFRELVSFDDAVFRGTGFFAKARFRKYAGFNHVTFHNTADFKTAIFYGQAGFDRTHFGGFARFAKARFRMRTHWSASAFGTADFENAAFEGSAIFFDCTFSWAPVFAGATLHPGTTFEQSEFSDTRSEGAARAYRTLKMAMESVRARSEQARFYALEHEALRRRPFTPRWVKLGSWLYETTSNYGQSALRPLVALAWVLLLSSLLYWPFAMHHTAASTGQIISSMVEDFGVSADFAMRQLVRPLELWTVRGNAEAAELFGKGAARVSVRYIALLQSLTSATLLALAALALRWRFKRE